MLQAPQLKHQPLTQTAKNTDQKEGKVGATKEQLMLHRFRLIAKSNHVNHHAHKAKQLLHHQNQLNRWAIVYASTSMASNTKIRM